MQPTNHSDRNKKFTRFGIYYALSVAAICVVVFAFADGLNSREDETVPAAASGNRVSGMVFSADSLLHRQFSSLENADNLLGLALASGKTREGTRVADSLRRVIPTFEQNFQFSLDSISRMSRMSSSVALKQTVDYFAAALALRSGRISVPRSASAMARENPVPGTLLNAGSASGMTVEELMKINPGLKGEMLKKDIRIADLEAAVNDLKKNPQRAVAAGSSAANRQLKEDYEELQKNYKTLTETNNRLRNAAPVPAAADPAESEMVKTARLRSAKMEQQLQEMNADLSFSTVDCNLSRADVNQIIYNGKQRKILLQQALDILTALKKSDNEEVQKRAAQKISQLNRIAMTVRD